MWPILPIFIKASIRSEPHASALHPQRWCTASATAPSWRTPKCTDERVPQLGATSQPIHPHVALRKFIFAGAGHWGRDAWQSSLHKYLNGFKCSLLGTSLVGPVAETSVLLIQGAQVQPLGQGTRSHMPQLKTSMLQWTWKSHVPQVIWHSQINSFFK